MGLLIVYIYVVSVLLYIVVVFLVFCGGVSGIYIYVRL